MPVDGASSSVWLPVPASGKPDAAVVFGCAAVGSAAAVVVVVGVAVDVLFGAVVLSTSAAVHAVVDGGVGEGWSVVLLLLTGE